MVFRCESLDFRTVRHFDILTELRDQDLCDVCTSFGILNDERDPFGCPLPQLRNSDITQIHRVIEAASAISLDNDRFRLLDCHGAPRFRVILGQNVDMRYRVGTRITLETPMQYWTPERDEELKRHKAAGLSAAKIEIGTAARCYPGPRQLAAWQGLQIRP
jgi:hypothetical protein